ncbi:MAG TPA: phosphoribosylformylglycinamidine cyclo-ligase, partial [Sphingomicrobium sp.]|nr:phosphoribosylformylglycinamidine cyclo-ligase [Sphingomicrobium sp.]
ATGRLDNEVAAAVIASIAQGCREAACALIGGETAEMPGMYSPGDYDLAGFCVGAVERDKVLTGATIRPGDLLLGLVSSGVHSNGFSLVRRIISEKGWNLAESLPGEGGRSLGQMLLEPTRIYVRLLLPLIQRGLIKGLAHITGGGLLENIPRVLPDGCHALVDTNSWQLPPIFAQLQAGGQVEPREMARTFNCGIGMVLIIEPNNREAVSMALGDENEIEIGMIEEGPRGCTVQGSKGRWGSTEDWSATQNA